MNKIAAPQESKSPATETPSTSAFPFFQKEIAQLQRDLDRMFHDFWGKGQIRMPDFAGMLHPDMDESEDEKAYHVALEMPGLDEKDVEVTYSDGMLTIKGEKKQEAETKDKNYYRKERTFGSFQRTFGLPGPVDEDAIEARVEKGVLKVTLPKAKDAETKKRTIAVKKA